MPNDIQKVEPPAIPLPPAVYQQSYFNQTNNVVRLFFNRVMSVVNTLLSVDDGGRYLYMPRGLFYSTTAQAAVTAGTGYPIEFENTYIGNGVRISNEGGAYTRITCIAGGVYNFQVTLMFEHTNSSDCTVWTWISKSGITVPYGGQKQSFKGNAARTVHWNFAIDVGRGEYIEMFWAVSDTAAGLATEAPTSPHPGIPSAIAAVSFVSNL